MSAALAGLAGSLKAIVFQFGSGLAASGIQKAQQTFNQVGLTSLTDPKATFDIGCPTCFHHLTRKPSEPVST
jgi:hypothetical protein